MSKIIIYADGGCRGNQNKENIGGWGAILKYQGKIKEIRGNTINTTNNIMEMTACIEAIKIIETNDIPIELYVDSQYVCNGLNKWIHNWKKKGWKTSSKKPVKNKNLWIELDKLVSSFSDIKVLKVKGHAGIELNERADELVNIAMDELIYEE